MPITYLPKLMATCLTTPVLCIIVYLYSQEIWNKSKLFSKERGRLLQRQSMATVPFQGHSAAQADTHVEDYTQRQGFGSVQGNAKQDQETGMVSEVGVMDSRSSREIAPIEQNIRTASPNEQIEHEISMFKRQHACDLEAPNMPRHPDRYKLPPINFRPIVHPDGLGGEVAQIFEQLSYLEGYYVFGTYRVLAGVGNRQYTGGAQLIPFHLLFCASLCNACLAECSASSFSAVLIRYGVELRTVSSDFYLLCKYFCLLMSVCTEWSPVHAFE